MGHWAITHRVIVGSAGNDGGRDDNPEPGRGTSYGRLASLPHLRPGSTLLSASQIKVPNRAQGDAILK